MPAGGFDPSGHGCPVFRLDPLCLASHGNDPFIRNGTRYGFHLTFTGPQMTAPSNAEDGRYIPPVIFIGLYEMPEPERRNDSRT